MKRRFRVVWSRVAQRDLTRIVEYIAQDSPVNARHAFRRIRKIAEHLYQSPARGRVVPELKAQGVTQYRELIVAPWRIMYRVAEKTVLVLSIIDSRRNVEDILLNRLIDER